MTPDQRYEFNKKYIIDKNDRLTSVSYTQLDVYKRQVRGCTGLSCPYNEGEQDILNPQGVNLIRSFTGRGIRVWGARTASSNPLWKYINVRRLFIFVEESLKACLLYTSRCV